MVVRKMNRIYLVRHCKASGQESTAVLTDEGVQQSIELADYFFDKKIDFIISSPFVRAVSTIRPLSDKLRIQIHTDDRLSERVLSADPMDDWMDKLKESFLDLDIKLPGGESSREAMDRGVSVVRELFEREEENIIVVSHGNLMSLIIKHFNESFGFEDWKALSNPDVYELYRPDESGEVRIARLWKEVDRSGKA